MGAPISEVISKLNLSPELSQQEILESFSHIELNESELNEAIIWAKRRKEDRLEQERRALREAETRKYLTGTQWTYDQTDGFMKHRAVGLFNGEFKFNGQVLKLYQLLCCYFSKDPGFFILSKELGVDEPSFEKGIYLGGNFGVGKTWLMQLFQRNQRQVYAMHNAKYIANLFEKEGEESMKQFIECPKLPVNDAQNFYHSSLGICIDDLGTEDLKSHFGNKKNVIGELIELRYDLQNVGLLKHVTTNLTGIQINEFYGGRVASRLRKCVNIIDFIGEDRRK